MSTTVKMKFFDKICSMIYICQCTVDFCREPRREKNVLALV